MDILHTLIEKLPKDRQQHYLRKIQSRKLEVDFDSKVKETREGIELKESANYRVLHSLIAELASILQEEMQHIYDDFEAYKNRPRKDKITPIIDTTDKLSSRIDGLKKTLGEMALSVSKEIDSIDKRIAENIKEMENMLSDAAKNLYGKVPNSSVVLEEGETVDDLTNAELGTIVDEYVKWALKEQAGSYYVNNAANSARDTATTEVETRYE